jgi:hypothetical protein
MPAKEIVQVLDNICERIPDNLFISADGSQFDSTRNKYLRQLDIDAYDFYLTDLLNMMNIPMVAYDTLTRILHQISHHFELKMSEGRIVTGVIDGTTLSGFAPHTTNGNTNTCLAIDNYVTEGITSYGVAAGDDNVLVTGSEHTALILDRLKEITSASNKPEKGKTGIIYKEFKISHDSVSFISKNYNYPSSWTPLMDRYVTRGAVTISNTPHPIIRNAVYTDLLPALTGMKIADSFRYLYSLLPRLAGKLDPTEEKEHTYKKELVLPVQNNSILETNIMENGGI